MLCGTVWPSLACTSYGCLCQPTQTRSSPPSLSHSPAGSNFLQPLFLWPQGDFSMYVHVTSVALLSSDVSRLFSEDGFSMTRKTLQSPAPPPDPTSCPTCGLNRHRRQTTTVAGDSSSQSTGGYIRGVSPSPSELALPNVTFSDQQLDQVDSFTFEVWL